MLGPDVPYGEPPEGMRGQRALAYMDRVRRGKAAGPWSLDVALEGHPEVHVRTTVVAPDSGEIILAKGRPPGGGTPYELQWALLNVKGDPGLATDVVQVLEAYEGERALDSIEDLRLEPEDERDGRFSGVRVQSGDRQDALFFGQDPSKGAAAPGGWAFTGRFGFWSVDHSGIREIFLAEGTRIAKGSAVLSIPRGTYEATVVAVDYPNRRFTIAPAATTPGVLIGRHFRFLNNGGSDTAYRAVSARSVPMGTEITVDVDPRIAEGHAVDAEDNLVIGDVELPLGNYGYYAGKTLIDQDGVVRYRTLGARRKTGLILDPDTHGVLPADDLRERLVAGPGEAPKRYVVYDYGIGDTVRFWHQASAVRTDHGYRVTSTSEGTLTLEDGIARPIVPGKQILRADWR